ncbi:hypothetical protein AQUCO_01700755v1 [Aquilegia coerulea]|uniref:DUF4005 domain-containing protein n=1 Tax=Aquilegia coerulea TaxID=218851 RepID=A0A2G5DPL1_AQUCA|nr:hypothetical protein AQUCO_01700755v1 [Aquilegia coerulea]
MFQFSFLPCLLLLLNFFPINTSSNDNGSEKVLISGYASIHTIRDGHPGQLPDLNLPCKSSHPGSGVENLKTKREGACPSSISTESVLARERHKALKRKVDSRLQLEGCRTATTHSSFPSFGSTPTSYWAPRASMANNSNLETNNDQIHTRPLHQLEMQRSFPSLGLASNSYWAPTSNSYWAQRISMAKNLDQLEKQHSFPSFGSTSNSYWASNASMANNSKVERHSAQTKYTKPYLDQLDKHCSFPSLGSPSNSKDNEKLSKRMGIEETSGHQELDLTLRL